MAEKSPDEEPLLKVIEGDHGAGAATQRTVITGGPSSVGGGGGGASKSYSVLAGNGSYLQPHHLPSHLQTTPSARSPRVETIVEPRATVQSQSLPDFRTTSTNTIAVDPNVPGPSGLQGSNSRQWSSEPGLQCGTAVQDHSPTSERASDDFPRRTRTHFTPQQLSCMEDKFFENQYPDLKNREEIAKTLKLQEMQVQVWFQNRRAKLRRKERRRLVSPYDKPASQQAPAFWPAGLPFDSTITDVGKGKSSEKSSRDIAAALQQRYPSRSQRGAEGKEGVGPWQEAQHHGRRQGSTEAPMYGRIITGYYPHPEYSQVESVSEDPIVGILTAADVPQGIPVIQGGPSHTSQEQRTTVLIPVAGQSGHIQQVIHPQSHPLQPGEGGGTVYNQPPVTLYGTPMVPPHQGGGGEGYMVPVITTPPHLQQQQQHRGSPHPTQQYRPPGSRGQ